MENVPYEQIARFTYDEYRLFSSDIVNHQTDLIKTYLWITSALLAGESGIYLRLLSSNLPFGNVVIEKIPSSFYLLALASILLACFAFVLGTDSLRGKGKRILPLSKISDDVLNKTNSLSGDEFYKQFIYNCDVSTEAIQKWIDRTGTRLRLLSFSIILSFMFFAASILNIFANRSG